MIELSPNLQPQASCTPIFFPDRYTAIPKALLEDKQLIWVTWPMKSMRKDCNE
jgi:hypothetical protein